MNWRLGRDRSARNSVGLWGRLRQNSGPERQGGFRCGARREGPDRGPCASPDGQWLATRASHENAVRLWTREGRPGPVLAGHTASVRTIAWAPGSDWVATGGDRDDGQIRLWQRKPLAGDRRSSAGSFTFEPGPVLERQESPVVSIAWSPKGETLVSGGEGGRICFWPPHQTKPSKVLDVASGLGQLAGMERRRKHVPVGLCVGKRSPGPAVACRRQRPGRRLPSNRREFAASRWSPDGRQLAVLTHDDGKLKLYNADGSPAADLRPTPRAGVRPLSRGDRCLEPDSSPLGRASVDDESGPNARTLGSRRLTGGDPSRQCG